MEHILSRLQENQLWGVEYMDLDTYAQEMVDTNEAYSVLKGDVILAVGGFLRLDGCRATCWSLLSEDIGMDFFHIHKAVLKRMKDSPYQRLEMAVAEYDGNAHRWALMLGFKHEGFMRKYFPDGSNATLYARIK